MIRLRHLSAVMLGLGALSTGLTVAPVHAENYPTRAVRVIVPFSPGGAVDTPARILLNKLSDTIGQQFVVDNRTGAGSTIGTELVAKSPPDGYTLLMISNTHVISAALYRKLKYDAINDFTPILQYGDAPNVLVVHPTLPAKSVKELIALAKAKPNQIDYASSGNGSSQHLFAALFLSMAGVKMNHIPYKGSGQARTDLISGQVTVGFPGISSVIQQIDSGRLRALAVTGSHRAAELPKVPTIAEAGVPGYEATLWQGFVGPAGLSKDIVAKLNAEISNVLKNKDIQSHFSKIGTEIVYRGPEQWGSLIKLEAQKWAKVVKETGAQVN